jgi:hypothetical protein
MLRLAIMATCGWLMLAVPGKAAMISASAWQHEWRTELDACVGEPITRLDFSGQQMLSHIHTIGFKMTMWDGDTARGDFDRGNLTLWLDDIDTGLLLNGFPNDQMATVTNWRSLRPEVATSLLAVLADGVVWPRLMCGYPSNNNFEYPRGALATLYLLDSPLPEPQSIWLCVAAALSFAGARWYGKR